MKIAKRFLLLNLVFVVLFFAVVKWFVFGSTKSLDTQWIKSGLRETAAGSFAEETVHDTNPYNRVRFNENSRFASQMRLFSREIDLEFSLYNGDDDDDDYDYDTVVDDKNKETARDARYGGKFKKNGHQSPETIRRFVIVTTWRSGSTFLGEIFNEMSGNYYHYEPLMNFDIRQIRTGAEAEQAVLQLERLFQCDYRHLDEFVDYASHHENVFTHNTRLWHSCNRNYKKANETVATNETKSTKLCYDLDFLSDFCALHPFQSMKVVRLRLLLIETLIKKYNLNIVFLVRDPRGVMESRKHRDWCPGNSDCDNSSFLCQDMITDYYTMLEFQLQYPKNFVFVKFEEMASDPVNYARELFKQLRIPFTLRIESYINNHSKYNYGGVSSTYRDSRIVPFMWMEKLTKSEIVHIQNQCTEALKLYNYTLYF